MTIKKFFLSAVTLTLLAAPAFSIDDGWGSKSEYTRMFNPRTIQTVSGKVVKLDRNYRPLKSMQPGFLAVIQPAQGEPIQVQVGPTWFTNFYRDQWKTKIGDQVTVTGSLVTIDGHRTLMVTKGQNGNHRMTVRTTQGLPVWDLGQSDF